MRIASISLAHVARPEICSDCRRAGTTEQHARRQRRGLLDHCGNRYPRPTTTAHRAGWMTLPIWIVTITPNGMAIRNAGSAVTLTRYHAWISVSAHLQLPPPDVQQHLRDTCTAKLERAAQRSQGPRALSRRLSGEDGPSGRSDRIGLCSQGQSSCHPPGAGRRVVLGAVVCCCCCPPCGMPGNRGAPGVAWSPTAVIIQLSALLSVSTYAPRATMRRRGGLQALRRDVDDGGHTVDVTGDVGGLRRDQRGGRRHPGSA